jgi:pilus assembly protein Flp/PilA
MTPAQLWHSRCDVVKRRAITAGRVIAIRTHGRARLARQEEEMSLISYLRSFVRHEEGQDLLEYALLVALIAIVAIGAVQAAGGSVKTIFQTIADDLATAA